MPAEGFTNITVSEETKELLDNLNQGFEPNMKRPGFLKEVLEFYQKYHCPECCAETAIRDKHHKC